MARVDIDLIGGAARLVAAIAFFSVAVHIFHRDVDPKDQGASRSFGVFWLGLAITQGMLVPYGMGYSFESGGLAAWRFAVHTLYPLMFVSMAGLVYFLLYVYTGTNRSFPLIIGFYMMLTIFNVWLIEGFSPMLVDTADGVHIQQGQTRPGWALMLFLVAFFAPPVLALLAFGGLFWRTQDPETRFRIATVTLALTTWIAISATITALEAANDALTLRSHLVSPIAGAIGSILILGAYRPPGWLQRRWARRATSPTSQQQSHT